MNSASRTAKERAEHWKNMYFSNVVERTKRRAITAYHTLCLVALRKEVAPMQYAALRKISRPAAQNMLDGLVSDDLLVRVNEGRRVHYEINPVFASTGVYRRIENSAGKDISRMPSWVRAD